jgi:hypothetical protein
MLWRLLKAHAWSTTVLVDELDAARWLCRNSLAIILCLPSLCMMRRIALRARCGTALTTNAAEEVAKGAPDRSVVRSGSSVGIAFGL